MRINEMPTSGMQRTMEGLAQAVFEPSHGNLTLENPGELDVETVLVFVEDKIRRLNNTEDVSNQ